MIHFLAPLAFFALLSVAIPIALHLLNRKEGTRVKVGSLKFIEVSESRRFKSLKLNELLLLFLRVSLLVLLAVLLARPLLENGFAGASKLSGWLLLDPIAAQAFQNGQTDARLDSLIEASYEVRALAAGLPRVNRMQEAADFQAVRHPWSLLREADQRLAADLPIAIFAPKQLRDLQGARPALARPVTWFSPPQPAKKQWIVSVRELGADSLLITAGASTAQHSAFRKHIFSQPQQAGPFAAIDSLRIMHQPATDSGRAQLVVRDQKGQLENVPIFPAPPPLKIMLVHDQARQNDADYFDAALRAAAEIWHAPLTITRHASQAIDSIAAGIDLLIWLSAQAAPALPQPSDRGRPTAILDAEGESFLSVATALDLEKAHSDNPVMLYRMAARPTKSGRVLWKTSDGAPILVETGQPAARQFQFHSRFHPAWTSLVVHPAFPTWIASLIEPQIEPVAPARIEHDLRLASAQQIQPRQIMQKASAATNQASPELHLPLWLAIAGLFVCERLLSERRQA